MSNLSPEQKAVDADIKHWQTMYINKEKELEKLRERFNRLYGAVDGVLVLTYECTPSKEMNAVRSILLLAKGEA